MPKLSPRLYKFRGIDNTSEPMSVGAEFLKDAINMDITKDGRLISRDGYKKVSDGSYDGAYSTADKKRMYVAKDYHIYRFEKTGKTFSEKEVATLIGDKSPSFTEVNGQVYFTNELSSGIIDENDYYLPLQWEAPGFVTLGVISGNLEAGTYQVVCTYELEDGRETGALNQTSIYVQDGQAIQISNIPFSDGKKTLVYIAPANSNVFQFAFEALASTEIWNNKSDDLGADLTTLNRHPMPSGCSKLAFYKGVLYAMENLPNNQTAIWASDPLGFHLFDVSSKGIFINGAGNLLVAIDGGLIIGTDKEIYSWNEELLKLEASFGSIPGQNAALLTIANNNNGVLIWTERGLCSALPVAMLTDEQISVAPGLSACGAVIESGGNKRYVVSLISGGKAYNKF